MKRLSVIVLALLAVLLLPVNAAAAPGGQVFGTVLSGSEEVPPRETRAAGFSIFHLDQDQDELAYRLIVANINNVVAAHVHLGAAGINGPVVAFLYGAVPPGGGPENGRLASGTITAADLIGPLAGASLSALADAMRAGNTYVNVHTNDGIDPPDSGPGDFPGGELRGQIRLLGPPS